jgi:hypothetical protein
MFIFRMGTLNSSRRFGTAPPLLHNHTLTTHRMADDICMSRGTAHTFLAIIITTLLVSWIMSWLNGRRVERLMTLLDEYIENTRKGVENEEQDQTELSKEVATGDGMK